MVRFSQVRTSMNLARIGQGWGEPHTHALPLRRAYPVPCRHGAPDFDLEFRENALEFARSKHTIVISAKRRIR